jgi:L,D-peptidoglycan transpeptidase YkuD (ErfK/YbiS/YcfS/YnhG family)
MATFTDHLRIGALISFASFGFGAAAGPAAATPPGQRAPENAALAAALQVLVIKSDGWDAPRGTAQRFERKSAGAPFRPLGAPLAVWLGRSGLGWRSDTEAAPPEQVHGQANGKADGPRKREGDGRSPAGVLTLGDALWGYDAQAPAGVRLPYRMAGPRDRCVDDAASPYYNQLTVEPADHPPPWQSAEALRLPTDHYKYLVVLNYNNATAAIHPGAGSCIFLHVAPPPGGPTAGCTALAEADLLTVLRWLDPQRHPVIVQLPAPAFPAAAAAWRLPPELVPTR